MSGVPYEMLNIHLELMNPNECEMGRGYLMVAVRTDPNDPKKIDMRPARLSFAKERIYEGTSEIVSEPIWDREIIPYIWERSGGPVVS